MSRVIKDNVYHSNKVSNIQPKEWRPEYSWLLPLSYVDGTFEAEAQNVWARAYAYSRPDWSTEKVAQLLDEFERVGLLQRTKDEHGRVWGFWTGSDNFTPPPSQRSHYKQGKRDLFNDKARARLEQVSTNSRAGLEQVQTDSSLCIGSVCVGVGSSVCACVGVCVCQAPKNSSETEATASAKKSQAEQQDQKPVCEELSSSKAKPTTAEPTAKADRKRKVLPPAEFAHAKAERSAAEEMAASAQWRKENGYEECADGIWRPEIGRSTSGFTGKGANGIWIKAEVQQ
jgi:hypothetical protein